MTISLSIDTSGLVISTQADHTDVLTPLQELELHLENVLNGIQAGEQLRFTQIATPSNPTASNFKLYAKSDGLFYKLNSSGTEVQNWLGFDNAMLLTEISTPAANPSSGQRKVYIKSDGYLYTLNSVGAEAPVSTAASYSLVMLSGLADGRNKKLTTIATPGDTIHTAHATNLDLIFLDAVNTDTTNKELYIEHGGTSVPDDRIIVTIPAEGGLTNVLPGIPLTNSLVLKCFASTVNLVNVNGFVRRAPTGAIKLSGSTDGRGIKVVATSTPGTTIHTAHATSKDQLFLYAYNNDSQPRKLTIEFGGTTSPDDLWERTIPNLAGLTTICEGVPLTNSLVVKAFGAAANQLVIFGYVVRV